MDLRDVVAHGSLQYLTSLLFPATEDNAENLKGDDHNNYKIILLRSCENVYQDLHNAVVVEFNAS